MVASDDVRRCDVLVAGGGPAGSTLATRLAGLGYTAVLVAMPRPPAIEGFSAHTLHALAAGRCETARRTVAATVDRIASWNGRTTAANREHLIDRVAFDAALLADARHAGVHVVPGRVVGTAHRGDVQAVHVETAGDTVRRIVAGFVVEARGRRVPARMALRGPATTCLARQWRFPAPATPRAAVAAFPAGWAWYAVLPDGTGSLQLFLDGARGRIPPRTTLEAYYDSMRAQVTEATAWVADGAPVGPVTARDATPRLAAGLVTDHMLRVGDAAAAIDPLSGHGAFEAVAGALLAAPVVNTLLRHPADRALARTLYQHRVRHTFDRLTTTGRAMYALETRWPTAAFWAARACWPPAPAPASSAPRPATLARRPVVVGDRIVAADVVVTAAQPDGVYHVDGVPLAPVLACLGRASVPRHTLTDLADRLGHPPDRLRRALAWLQSVGLAPDAPNASPRMR